MNKTIEDYVVKARAAGMNDSQIKQKLTEAGWVPEQVEPILIALSQTDQQPTQTQPQPGMSKQHLSIRRLPDLFMDYVWKKIF